MDVAHSRTNKGKILIIEDEEVINKMYTLKFTSSGYEVIQAFDGAQGLELAKREHPDLVLLDVIIPKRDGFEVLKELKADPATKDLKIVLLTNLGQPEDQEKAVNMGAAGYLIKATMTPAQVLAKAEEFLRQ